MKINLKIKSLSEDVTISERANFRPNVENGGTPNNERITNSTVQKEVPIDLIYENEEI